MKFKDIKEYDLIIDDYLKNFKLKLKGITSLEGCPNEINGVFDCSENNLESLEYSPKIINGIFYCNNNKLKSLKGCPKIIEGDFNCRNNKLITLYDSPKIINGDFYCYNNKLKSLEGDIKEIKGIFDITKNKYLKNVKEQIIKHQIKAELYKTDEDNFYFEEIAKEFIEYGNQKKIKELKKQKMVNFNKTDYGLGI